MNRRARSRARRTCAGATCRFDAVTPSHVDDAALDGDAWALGLWTELATLLAVALGNVLKKPLAQVVAKKISRDEVLNMMAGGQEMQDLMSELGVRL